MSVIWHPVRRLIVERTMESPATLPELAEAAGVHLNTARAHAIALEEAGILRAEPGEPAGRGRPPFRYRLAGDFTLPTTDFRGLAELLAAAVARSGQSPAELRRLGQDWGRYLAGRPGAQTLERVLPAALERLGFAARIEHDELILSSCPCPLVSPDNPALLCGLAIAVAEGVLAGAGSDMRVADSMHDPVNRRCTVALAS